MGRKKKVKALRPIEEIKPIKGNGLLPLKEVLSGASKKQGEFLYYRVLDIPEGVAIELCGIKQGTLWSLWRRQEGFARVEEYILSQKEEYAPLVRAEYRGALLIKSQVVLNKLIEEGLEWERLEEKEKKFVIKAIEIAMKFGEEKKGGEEPSYEEALLIKHTKRGEENASEDYQNRQGTSAGKNAGWG